MAVKKKDNDLKISHQYQKIGKYNGAFYEDRFYLGKNYSAIINPTNTIPIEKRFAIRTVLL